MLRISGISKIFNTGTNDQVRALTDVSLDLEEGVVPGHHRDERVGEIDTAQCRRRIVQRGLRLTASGRA